MGGSTNITQTSSYVIQQEEDPRAGKDREEKAPFEELSDEERDRKFGDDTGNVGSLILPKYGEGSGTNTP